MRAIFLDRDGVINENRDEYVRSVEQFRLLPGVLEALRLLAATPFKIIIATNQAGVGRGLFSQHTLDEIHEWLRAAVTGAGGRLDAIYACVHPAAADCSCRKPRPGLLLRAGVELGVDVQASYFVGDALTDVEAAMTAGCRPILVRTGRGAMMVASDPGHSGLTIVDDLLAAVRQILAAEDVLTMIPQTVSEEARPHAMAGSY